MKNTPIHDSASLYRTQQLLLLIGIFLVAINLRPALAAIGPLIQDIQEATGLSNLALGLLTTLPLLAFGVVSTFTSLVTSRFGVKRTLAGAMLLLAVGIIMRSSESVLLLYAGTLLLGVGIAFGNVLLPSITKSNFESKAGWVTSLYSSVMALGAAIAAGVSVPLAQTFGWGWQLSLASWASVALVAFAFWFMLVWKSRKEKIKSQNSSILKGLKRVGRSPLAWLIAFYMGFQSLTFYAILAWLPSILQYRGYDPEYAGWMLSLCQATGILGSLIVPTIAGRQHSQRAIIIVLIVAELIALSGLLLPNVGITFIWVSMLGFVLGGTFGLSLLLLVLRSKDSQSATELSGMAQSIGYLLAATGPFIVGGIFDITQSWTYPIAFLIVVTLMKFAVGMGAGKSQEIATG